MTRTTRTTFAAGAATAAAALAVSAAVAMPASAASTTAGRSLGTTLTGAAETAGGDTDGTGTATVTINYGKSRLCFDITVSAIGTAVAAHVHEGPAGANGPVIIPLTPPADGSSSGCVTVSRSILKGILKDPSDYYVNVHTAAFPGGAVRGQL